MRNLDNNLIGRKVINSRYKYISKGASTVLEKQKP